MVISSLCYPIDEVVHQGSSQDLKLNIEKILLIKNIYDLIKEKNL